MAAADWSGQILTGVSTLLEQAQMLSHKAPPSGGVRLAKMQKVTFNRSEGQGRREGSTAVSPYGLTEHTVLVIKKRATLPIVFCLIGRGELSIAWIKDSFVPHVLALGH